MCRTYLKESTWFGTKYRQPGNYPAIAHAFPANYCAFLPSPWCNSHNSFTTFLANVKTFPAITHALPTTEDDLSIFQVRTWTQYSKLGSVCLLRFFNMSLCCRDMMEDDLSIFWVRTWTQDSKLGGVRLLRFFDMSLCCQNMTEDDLSIFWVRSWTGHGKLGGVRL